MSNVRFAELVLVFDYLITFVSDVKISWIFVSNTN